MKKHFFCISRFSSAIPTLSVWASLLEAVLYFYAAVSLIAYMMEDDRVASGNSDVMAVHVMVKAWSIDGEIIKSSANRYSLKY